MPHMRCERMDQGMTDVEKVTAESINSMLSDYHDEICRSMAIGGGDPESYATRILSVITALVAERDQANTIAGDAHAEIERLVAQYRAVVAERDEAIRRAEKAEEAVLKALQHHSDIHIEQRDAVERILRDYFQETDRKQK